MKKRLGMIFLLGVLLLGLLLVACGNSGGSRGQLRFGTAGSGGTYYSFATQFADLSSNDFDFEIKTTAGSAANIRLMQEGFIDLAIVQSDLLESAQEGTSVFAGDKKVGSKRIYSAVAGLYTEAVQIIVKADAGINSLKDLEGRSVSVGEEESGVLQNAEQILKTQGLTFEDLDVHYMSFSQSADAIRSGTIEAFFCTAGAPTSAVSGLAEDVAIQVLDLDAHTIETLEKLYKGYTDCVIPAGTYKGQEAEVRTLGVKAVLIASNEVPAEQTQKLTELLFKNAQALSGNTCTDGPVDTAFATSAIPIDFHKGAADYYQAQGTDVAVYEGSGSSGVFASQDD